MRIGSSNFISAIDCIKGYFQIPMKKNSRVMTAFISDRGLNQFTVMPFGLKNACATFRVIDKILVPDRRFAMAYVDDVAVGSDNLEQHLEHLGSVLEHIGAAGLTLKLSKCKFGVSHLKFLGHVVGPGRHWVEK